MKNTKEMFEVITSLKKQNTNLDAIFKYVPTANIEEITIVNDLVQVLKQTDNKKMDNAIWYVSPKFKHEIGYRYLGNFESEFDESKFVQLIFNVIKAAEKQKKKSNEELLSEMRKYKEKLEHAEQQKRTLAHKISYLIETEAITLEKASKPTGFQTKRKFKKVAKLLKNIHFDVTRHRIIDNDITDEIIKGISVTNIHSLVMYKESKTNNAELLQQIWNEVIKKYQR